MSLRNAFDTGPEIFAWAVLAVAVALRVGGYLGELPSLILALTAASIATGLRVRKIRAGGVELDGGNDDRED